MEDIPIFLRFKDNIKREINNIQIETNNYNDKIKKYMDIKAQQFLNYY